ncbi:DNA-methyltransferase [Stenotrophomonas maltophilia]|jgi:DNA modification methylase|uniref:DNA-methyltransferase n=1 Tax=Stenotrophomonas maltophilia TaxID=40324 RepID=UPI003D7635FC
MIHIGDCLEVMRGMAAGSVHTCVTSPPYFGLRDYGHDGQIGLEQKPEEYVSKLVEVFREVHRVLRDDGTLWLNLGDSYANDGKWGGSSGGKHASALHGATSIGRGKVSTGLKPKDLIGIPWRIAFALQEDGWFLRQDIIWSKPNPMPESVTDRCTKAHEYLFLLSKSQRYYFDAGAIREQAAHDPAAGRNRWDRTDYDVPGQTPQKRRSRAAVPPRHAACGSTQDGLDAAGRDGARNKRSVWTVATRPFRDAHFATFPEQLIEPCILAGAPAGGLVLDPFMGAGTTAVVAERLGRQWLGCELNPEYAEIAEARIRVAQPGFAFGETA